MKIMNQFTEAKKDLIKNTESIGSKMQHVFTEHNVLKDTYTF
jgi:hypothetical protein